MKNLALALSALAGTAGAQQVQVFSGNPTFMQTLTFDRFDGDANLLVGVCITLDLTVEGGSLSVDNDGFESAMVDVEFGAGGALSSTDVFFGEAIEASITATDTFMLDADDGDANPGNDDFDTGGTDVDTLLGTEGTDSDFANITGTNAQSFAGPGTFEIDVNVSQILDFGAAGGVSGAFTPSTAFGTVTIEYKVIPAPATAVLAAFGGLATVRRSRR